MYATTNGTTLTLHEGKPDLAAMQAAVGGYIATADRYPSTERENVTIDIWCNDEGLLEGLPCHWVRIVDAQPIVGNLCITATDETEGETISATEQEIRDALTETLAPLPAARPRCTCPDEDCATAHEAGCPATPRWTK